MDQCANCQLVGNISECQKTPCSHRETWVFKEISQMNEEMLEDIQSLTKELYHFHTILDGLRSLRQDGTMTVKQILKLFEAK